jgi:lipid A ethanolaminephosphotransferase
MNQLLQRLPALVLRLPVLMLRMPALMLRMPALVLRMPALLFSRQSASFALHPLWYALLLALVTTAAFHGPLLAQVASRVPGQWTLQLTLWLLVLLLNSLLFVLCSLPRLQKPLLMVLVLSAVLSHYFISHFGTVIDKAMLQNVLETDAAEAAGLLNADLVLTLTAWSGLLLWLQLRVRLSYRPWRRYAVQWLAAVLAVLTLLGALAATQFSTLAPFFRNYRDVKFFALPLSPVVSAVSLSKHQLQSYFPQQFQLLGTDVQNTRPAAPARTLVLVLGETARADHFQLNGYARPTNPQLSQLPVVSFSAVSSCGTATAHSVPCMFSALGRLQYDEAIAKNSSNVLDILHSSGVDVLWLDNNSGCKGVCDRLPAKMLYDEVACREQGHCADSVLLAALQQELARPQTQDRIIVLHQLGSHGPEYYKRSSETAKVFGPECRNKELNQCSAAEVVNAYDNSLLATDALLAGVIHSLQAVPQAAMLYVSDHGESLGENGVYLHGLPYWMAPKAQTQVPLIWWMNGNFAEQQRLSAECLARQAATPISHDHLFHSLPALFDRQSKVFDPAMNLFAPCQGARRS